MYDITQAKKYVARCYEGYGGADGEVKLVGIQRFHS